MMTSRITKSEKKKQGKEDEDKENKEDNTDAMPMKVLGTRVATRTTKTMGTTNKQG